MDFNRFKFFLEVCNTVFTDFGSNKKLSELRGNITRAVLFFSSKNKKYHLSSRIPS